MTVDIANDLASLIEAKVRSGLYASPGEVVREALQLLDARDETRRKIAEGAASLRRGEGVDGEEVFERLKRELDAIEQGRLV